ncbi:hypothetical protein, partial [Nonomuraea lactucae]|uniref:hypothetical protein n=1 Tax=Nonomuraea lactucae TaxID=2249762 RepID=UPI001965B04C
MKVRLAIALLALCAVPASAAVVLARDPVAGLVAGQGAGPVPRSGMDSGVDSVAGPVAFGAVVPAPVSAVPAPGVTYRITAATAIHSDVAAVGDLLARQLRRATGFPVPVVSAR